MSGNSLHTVLVIEDDEDLRTLVVSILREEGYNVLVAEHGKQGLDRVAERMPDLILLDMNMPVMSGSEFSKHFRARYETAKVPILVMTAAASARKSAKDISADGYIGKPFELDALLALVKRHLKGKQSSASATP